MSLQHHAKVLLGRRIGESNSGSAVVENDHGPVGKPDFAEKLTNRTVTPRTERVDVANARAM